MDWGGHYYKSHKRSTVLRRASLNEKKGAFREQVTGTGILLMAGHEFQAAKRKRFREKERWEMGSEM